MYQRIWATTVPLHIAHNQSHGTERFIEANILQLVLGGIRKALRLNDRKDTRNKTGLPYFILFTVTLYNTLRVHYHKIRYLKEPYIADTAP